ncbi:glycerol-3-phosphate acyltransferase 1, mitochondrial isoform X2 [Trichogramma pretiosum]|uniref:glycerol-3-phosphate acyltransferase 1, mitochondrial isoform X2 n=1 Tax=Trichogramma pretiosum TaxID=7493 RepID=UPI0006C9E249|nr:glycerol-3-phosphate acyltransferase 1, mitochondrial isoform X2 [Trichogramma pretiosum]XP_023313903.1 glycerol-3-phosphate acyltransferase 1, mitochondrial isoform X2 [Trichogramma pretiosum]
MDGLVGLFLVCGVIYYFLGRRATDMVDVIQNRLTEVYSSWDGNSERDNANARTLSTTELRRAGLAMRNRAAKSKEIARAVRSSSLYQIKETEITVPDPAKNSSFVYYCCGRCTPQSRDSLAAQAAKQSQKSSITNLLIADPQPKNIWSKLFSHTYHVYSFKKYDYPKVTRTVLNDERIKDAIKETAVETARETGCSEDEAMRQSEARAKSILERMQSGLSDLMLRFTAWTLYKLLPCFIRSAAIQTRHLDMLRQANDTQIPLVFMPLHRSHLDYVMISFLTLTNGIRSPLVAAGDNLRIPLFGWLMSGLGAFFIKRRMDPVAGRRDLIYRATLQTYIMECLRAGHNLEFFIEGGRSRTGKPCPPKGGILSVVVDAFMDGTIEDALLVPVSMNYERLVDGNFVREQLGQPKKMETFGSTIRAMWNTLRGSYGIVKLEVCQPFSLREMVRYFQLAQQTKAICSPADRQLKVTASSSSLYGTDCVSEDLRLLVDKIGQHVVYDCSKSTPIMSTNVVAFLLLNKFRDGCSMVQLVEAVDSLRAELRNAQRDVAFCGESIDIVNHALDILGPGLVKMERQEVTDTVNGRLVKKQAVVQVRPIAILPNVIETAYYGNTLLVHYCMDSVVITALYAALRTQINSPQAIAANNLVVTHEELMENALAICDILKHEFIFCRPCQTLEDCINQAVDRVKAEGIIAVPSEGLLEEEIWSRRFAKTLECESEEEEEFNAKKIRYKLRLESEYSNRMEFLHTLLRPLIDTYTFSAYSLRKLVGRSMAERELVQEILSEIKSNIDTGIVNYGESLCVDPIKNSLKLFEKKNILECHVQENAKIYYLKDEFDDEEAVNQIYETLATFKWTRNID